MVVSIGWWTNFLHRKWLEIIISIHLKLVVWTSRMLLQKSHQNNDPQKPSKKWWIIRNNKASYFHEQKNQLKIGCLEFQFLFLHAFTWWLKNESLLSWERTRPLQVSNWESWGEDFWLSTWGCLKSKGHPHHSEIIYICGYLIIYLYQFSYSVW